LTLGMEESIQSYGVIKHPKPKSESDFLFGVKNFRQNFSCAKVFINLHAF